MVNGKYIITGKDRCGLIGSMYTNLKEKCSITCCTHNKDSNGFHLSKLLKSVNQLGDNCIQNFHLGRYIVRYTVGNLVLRRRASGAVKRDF